MSENTKIEWCDATFNPWIGCTKVGPGCDNCYAAQQDKFRSWTPEGWGGPRKRTSVANWRQPAKWNASTFVQCAACGWRGEHDMFQRQDADARRSCCPACGHFSYLAARRRVFCASLADVFDNQVDPQWRADLFDLIGQTPNLDWLLLTKRIGNVAGMVPAAWLKPGGWPKHVRIGITIVNQPEADRDIWKLLALPCPNFLSMEPLLGPVDLSLPTRLYMTGRGPYGKDEPIAMCDHCCNGDRCDDPTHCDRGRPDWEVKCYHCRGTGRGKPIDWVIAGGESGPGARPSHPDWYRSLRDQCAGAGVPFLFKQWGEWGPTTFEAKKHKGPFERGVKGSDVAVTRFGHAPHEFAWPVVKVGKKAAGRLLDGIEYNGFPT